jgi:hypothetical protein
VLRFLWTYFFVMNANFSCRRVDGGQLLMRECQLLRDVLGGVFQTWATAEFFIDTSDSSVNVRAMLSGVFSFQFSVFSGKESQTGDGAGSVHLLYAARERGSLRWWRGERRLGRRRDAGSGWYFSCCRRYEFCFFGMSSALFCTSSAFFCTFSASCFGSGGETHMDVNCLPQNRYVVDGGLGASARRAVDVRKRGPTPEAARDGEMEGTRRWLARAYRASGRGLFCMYWPGRELRRSAQAGRRRKVSKSVRFCPPRNPAGGLSLELRCEGEKQLP